jgi:hypothetical protein
MLMPAVIIAAVLLFLLFASRLRDTYAPSVPVDVFHNAVINDAGCTTCHTPGRQAPLRLSHAPDTECLDCHHTGNRKRRLGRKGAS